MLVRLNELSESQKLKLFIISLFFAVGSRWPASQKPPLDKAADNLTVAEASALETLSALRGGGERFTDVQSLEKDEIMRDSDFYVCSNEVPQANMWQVICMIVRANQTTSFVLIDYLPWTDGQ